MSAFLGLARVQGGALCCLADLVHRRRHFVHGHGDVGCLFLLRGGLRSRFLSSQSQFGSGRAQSLRMDCDLAHDLLDAFDEDVEPVADLVDFVVAMHLDAPRQVAFALRNVLQT